MGDAAGQAPCHTLGGTGDGHPCRPASTPSWASGAPQLWPRIQPRARHASNRLRSRSCWPTPGRLEPSVGSASASPAQPRRAAGASSTSAAPARGPTPRSRSKSSKSMNRAGSRKRPPPCELRPMLAEESGTLREGAALRAYARLLKAPAGNVDRRRGRAHQGRPAARHGPETATSRRRADGDLRRATRRGAAWLPGREQAALVGVSSISSGSRSAGADRSGARRVLLWRQAREGIFREVGRPTGASGRRNP